MGRLRCSHGAMRRPHYSLSSIYHHSSPLIWPIFRAVDQPGTHWILNDVFPFFAHAFIVPQNVIEEALLPDLSVTSRPAISARQRLLQCCYPATEHESFIATDEQMDMVRHDDIASNCNTEFGTATSELDKSGMCLFRCENLLPAMCTKRDKIDWRIISLKDFIDSQRTTTEFLGGTTSSYPNVELLYNRQSRRRIAPWLHRNA